MLKIYFELYFVKIYILWHKCPLILKVAIKFNNIEGNESKDLKGTPLSQDTYTLIIANYIQEALDSYN